MSKLSPDQWQALSPHLDHALEMTGEERSTWLSLANRYGGSQTIGSAKRTAMEKHQMISLEILPKVKGIVGEITIRQPQAGD